MDEPQNWPARLSAPQRNNFFFGKMMGVAQFEREQRYGMGQRWLINRLTIGTGVLCGLEVTLTAEGKKLRIAQGVAVDPWGREIVVNHAVEDFDPFAKRGGCGCGDGAPITEAKDYMLCLTYRECTANDQPVQYADDCPGQPDCQPDTTVETFGLALSDVVTPAPFDCVAWTAGVSAPGRGGFDPGDPRGPASESRPTLGGDLTRPARPPLGGGLTPLGGETPAPGSSPPSIDVLRARLAEQFGSTCAAPATTCVPLALVTAKKEGDTWTLTVAEGPRRRVYTQAQMLEAILCLVSCCTGGHTTGEPPRARPFQVTSVDVGAARLVGNVIDLNPVTPTTSGGRPDFAFPAAGGDEDTALVGPIIIRVTFNGRLDKDTVKLATGQSARSVLLTMTDDTTDPANPVEVNVPLQLAMVPDSQTADSSTLLLFMGGGQRGGATASVARFVSALASGGVKPGKYTLILYGDDVAGSTGVPAQNALKSLASTSPAQDLDGDSNGSPGGAFVFPFSLSALP